jgi:hypothetical protein
VGLRGMTDDQVLSAVLGAGWVLVSASPYDMPGIEARTWVVRRGEAQATVYLYRYRNVAVARRLELRLAASASNAAAREGGTLVSVFNHQTPAISQELLQAILARRQGGG